MRPTYAVDLQDSLELAARKLRENGTNILPVTQDGFLAGVITEQTLASALAISMERDDPVETITQGVLTAHPRTTGAEALRLFDNNNTAALVVIDEGGRVLGILTPSDLFPKRIIPPRPPVVGGMATPFGVHLTTGAIKAGVGDFALISTGMVLFGLFLLGNVSTTLFVNYLNQIHVPERLLYALQGILPFAVFLLGMRLIPLSGIHAAEHKVVHAIERGEDLTVATVKRMPRVHPRCGTNFAVGASIFIGVVNLFAGAGGMSELAFLAAAIATLALWKPLGSAMQYYVTTKRPTNRQLEMGIRSGEALLKKYATAGSPAPNIFRRLYNSGMFHVMLGSALALGIYSLILLALGLPLDAFG